MQSKLTFSALTNFALSGKDSAFYHAGPSTTYFHRATLKRLARWSKVYVFRVELITRRSLVRIQPPQFVFTCVVSCRSTCRCTVPHQAHLWHCRHFRRCRGNEQGSELISQLTDLRFTRGEPRKWRGEKRTIVLLDDFTDVLKAVRFCIA